MSEVVYRFEVRIELAKCAPDGRAQLHGLSDGHCSSPKDFERYVTTLLLMANLYEPPFHRYV